MEEVELQELPPPDVPDPSGKFCVGWSSVRMREYARQAVLMERERCARIVDGVCPASNQLDLRKTLTAAIRKG